MKLYSNGRYIWNGGRPDRWGGCYTFSHLKGLGEPGCYRCLRGKS